MGKKTRWFSAIKKVFLPRTKDKLPNESDRKSTKEKKRKGLAKLRRGETNSFIPLFKEPSSIEKILDEAEREHNLIFRPPTPPEQPNTPPFVTPSLSPRIASPRVASPRATSPRATLPSAASPRATSPRAASPRTASPRAASPRPVSLTPFSPKLVQHHREIYHRPEPTLRNHHASATKIQAAYRGYAARRSFRSLKGLVRLHGVIRGQNVKRQTMNAMKYMQLLVRVQSQIQSRRIQTLENQARRQAQYKFDKEVESTLGKWSQASESGNHEDWDDSLLTRAEIEARMQRKVDAVIRRERATSYAYSHQLRKATPKSAQSAQADIWSNGFPWWWNWLEHQLPLTNPAESSSNVTKNFQPTPPRPHSETPKLSPRPSSGNKQQNPFVGFENVDTPTPRSSRSTAFGSRTPVHRTPPSYSIMSKYSRVRAGGGESPFPTKDDDSLMSCPPFSVPNYMAPTVSTKAKVRANSSPNERIPGTPSSEKRRLSFPLTQGTDSFKYNNNKASPFFAGKDSSSHQGDLHKHQSPQSMGNLSVNSTVSMPAAVGRKPFNRFV